MFVNTLTADDQYSLLNRHNLTQPFRTQLSQKQKLFLNFFLQFRNVHEILNICKEKMTFIADLFPKLRTPKNVVRYLSKKSRFKGPFDWQHGKHVQTLLSSEPQHRFHI